MRLIHNFILFLLPVCGLLAQIEEDDRSDKLTQIGIELEVTVYPNPVIDYFNISTNTPFSGSYVLSNMIGKKLSTGALSPDQSTEVMIDNYHSGIYLLSVFDSHGKRRTTRKIYKE